MPPTGRTFCCTNDILYECATKYGHHLRAREDSAGNKPTNTNTTAPPALSPSAIVGLAIIGGLFLTVLLAAVLRLCYSPSPQESNQSSLYRPDDSNTTQLAHMKQVRDFNREAAWERARMCEVEGEMDERASTLSGKRVSKHPGTGGWRSPGKAAGKRRMVPREVVPGRRGSAEWVGGAERRDRAWRARMGVSAMEASGQVEMPEKLDLIAGQAAYGANDTVGSSAVLPHARTRPEARQTVDYEEDYSIALKTSMVQHSVVDVSPLGDNLKHAGQENERADAGDGRRHTVPLMTGARSEERRTGLAL